MICKTCGGTGFVDTNPGGIPLGECCPDCTPQHDCREHLKYELVEWTETHGLDCGPYEYCSEESWVCVLCGERFTAEDIYADHSESLRE